MVYLTYIIGNYDNLLDTVLFFHPHRITWHNGALLILDSKKTIERLSDAKVTREATSTHVAVSIPVALIGSIRTDLRQNGTSSARTGKDSSLHASGENCIRTHWFRMRSHNHVARNLPSQANVSHPAQNIYVTGNGSSRPIWRMRTPDG